MDWTMLGAIGEMVGAAAVVGSLLYVATQIRHNTAVARSDAYSQMATQAIDFLDGWSADPEWRAVLSKILNEDAGPGDLTDDETLIALLKCHAILRWFEQTYRKVGDGILPSDALDTGQGLLRTRFAREACPSLRHEYPEDFWQWVVATLGIPDTAAQERLEAMAEYTRPAGDSENTTA